MNRAPGRGRGDGGLEEVRVRRPRPWLVTGVCVAETAGFRGVVCAGLD
jgi:hypothetical protein